ncbi:FAD-dependent oxidoreductase [Streptacidiphilus rugosus]|uniref:FAD-dependent oxidoreductase n=1 Tax=Streptacidiphilus rugosus TaxID=405783 RepID=UPI000691F837|nr:FAD-dependent oxidoreductase [Streptacidiphilus rugosus]
MSRGSREPDPPEGEPKPVILAVDDDPQVLRAIRRDLRRAYADRYRILTVGSSKEAMRALDQLDERRQEPALFLVDQRMPEITGVQFLVEALARFPGSRRVLLTAYAELETALTGINHSHLDHYLLKPWGPPEELLYPVLDRLLDEWSTGRRPTRRRIEVVGHASSPATRAVRDFLTRNGRPYRLRDPLKAPHDPATGRLLARANGAALPLVALLDGEVLSAPDEGELAERLGRGEASVLPHYECVIVGAGPAGLAAAVYAASDGLRTLVLDAVSPGGQAECAGHIENHLGFPSGLSGRELARRASVQALGLGAELLCPAEVVALRRDDPAKILTLADGSEASAETVLLCPGASYNRLDAPGAERFEGVGLYYGLANTETQACLGLQVFVVGGANTAGLAAIRLAKYAAEVTLLVRGDSLLPKMSPYLVDEIERTPNIVVRLGATVRELLGGERLERIVVHDASTGRLSQEETGFLFLFIGARPHTDWLEDVVERDAHGFVLTGSDLVANGGEVPSEWSLERAPYPLETSVPGVFAAGDARAQSVKRVAAGLGEGSMAAALIQRYRVTG